jgi:hypothetical protein
MGLLRALCGGCFVVALAGCATAAKKVDEPTPADYRAQIAAIIKSGLKDPYTVRDAAITEAGPRTVGAMVTATGVCARYNAKNSYGAYTGIQEQGYVFRDGRPISVIITDCDKGTFGPFPELGAPPKV